MVNAWRRVTWLCRVLVIIADLVERAEEAFAAIDRLLEALKLIAVGTNLKQEFERLDGGGDTELNQEGGGGQAGQLANEEPFDFAGGGRGLTNISRNRIFRVLPFFAHSAC